VYAAYLANLVPRNISSRTPEVAVITGFLEKAGLPIEVVAYAACVLDALSPQFGGAWRGRFGGLDPSACDFYFGCNTWQRPTSPDLVVLSVLALAQGFLDDGGRSNSQWARIGGVVRLDAKDVELTKMCILKDMDYGLFRINGEMVQRRVRDMQCACDFACTAISPGRLDSVGDKNERRPRLSLSIGSSGLAIWAHGVQTPEPSP
jgi:hypothetical protein